jgi:hypothetical protein
VSWHGSRYDGKPMFAMAHPSGSRCPPIRKGGQSARILSGT